MLDLVCHAASRGLLHTGMQTIKQSTATLQRLVHCFDHPWVQNFLTSNEPRYSRYLRWPTNQYRGLYMAEVVVAHFVSYSAHMVWQYYP